MKPNANIKLARLTALLSFLLGTGIFLSYYLTRKDELLFAGYIYLFFAILFNVLVLVVIWYNAYKDPDNAWRLMGNSLIMLLNIPVTIFYVVLVINSMNDLGITFINDTKHELTDVKVMGCQEETFANMAPGQSVTVWMDIPGDCSIDIVYNENNHRKEETVMGYVTQSMGGWMEYRIGKPGSAKNLDFKKSLSPTYAEKNGTLKPGDVDSITIVKKIMEDDHVNKGKFASITVSEEQKNKLVLMINHAEASGPVKFSGAYSVTLYRKGSPAITLLSNGTYFKNHDLGNFKFVGGDPLAVFF